MNGSRDSRSSIRLACLAALGLTAGVAGAQVTEPLLHSATGPNEVILTNTDDSEVISFDERRDVRVCNQTARSESNLAQGSTTTTPEERAVTLEVEHEGSTNQVQPGECRVFQAQRMTLSPEEALQPGWDLRVRVESGALGSLTASSSSQTAESSRSAAADSTTHQSTAQGQQSASTTTTTGATQSGTTGQSDTTTQTGVTAQSGTSSQQPSQGIGQSSAAQTQSDDQQSIEEAQEAVREAQDALRQANQALAEAESALRQAEAENTRQAAGQGESTVR